MKRLILIIVLFLTTLHLQSQIIADHTIIDDYDIIPQQYIDEVKKMYFTIAGESHAYAYRIGLELLEAYDATYTVNYSTTAPPETATSNYLRTNRVMYGDLNNSSSWVYSYGEEDWYTSATAISRTKAGITYCNNNGYKMDVLGFGFCWDPAITDMTAYLSATQEYIDYCATNGYTNKIIFTTGPVDLGYSLAEGYNAYLNWTAIRNYVNTDKNYILLDYADILCYDDGSETPNTRTYNGHVYPCITTTNGSPEETGHISNAGALRLGKAVWWTLARIAGWNGEAETVYTADYYCSPDGDDDNDGSYNNPWATFQKAASVATAGDTVYFRGGTYSMSTRVELTRDGTDSNPICFFNYPSETPVFDFYNMTPVGTNNFGIYLNGANYVNFRGLEIKRVRQVNWNDIAVGIYSGTSNEVVFTNMHVHHIGGKGFRIINSDNFSWYNCDAHHCADSLRDDAGNGGSGFAIYDNTAGGYFYFYGCRAWKCSDQGFSGVSEGEIVYENCWSFNHGYLSGPGLGAGFKYSLTETGSNVKRTFNNCLSAYNTVAAGFNDNNYLGVVFEVYMYNNTSYRNDRGFIVEAAIDGNPDNKPVIYRNNIEYNNTNPGYFARTYTHDHNSWDSGVTISDADFLSVDSTGITGPRQADGSLPDLDFLKLAPTSDLIDAGVDVGLPYASSAPDLGYSEFNEFTIINPYNGVNFSNYYKSNFHTHTNQSDGSATVVGQINSLSDAGYDIFSITDHDEVGPDSQYPTDPSAIGTTWPWTEWISQEPNLINTNGTMQTSAFYPDLGNDGVFAINGNELSTMNHVVSLFNDADYQYWPAGTYNTYGSVVSGKNGYMIWAHANEYDNPASWYVNYIEDYPDTWIGLEIHNAGKTDTASSYYDSLQELWDAINALRDPNDLQWGFSNLDRHSVLTGFRNYNHHFMSTLTESSLRANLLAGAFTASFNDLADLSGTVLTPMLTGVTVSGNVITLTASDCNGYQWYDNTSTLIGTDNSIDVSNTNTNFVRAVLYNSYGRTYTQPFGIDFFDGIDSTATDILAFTLPTQTGAATINSTNHTVAIEVNYLATVTNLTPYISLSYGATISPESMTSRDFTTPQTYTVTALDGTTTQNWTVTVTQEEEPYVPPEVDTSRIIKFNGGHLRKFRP